MASLIFGVLGGVLLSVIFGIIALKQIKTRGQSGRGMAIAGLVLSALWTLFIVAAIIIAVATNDGSVRATNLVVGDCIESIPGDNARVTTLPKVSCAKPHEGEVYAQLRVTASSFPGQSSLESNYRDRCFAAFASYAPNAADSEEFESYVLYPTQATWNQGDRDVVCIAITKVKRTGSIKG
ncbi:hypothetical protein B1987_03695 [Mycobacterium kansasii]|nr:hypothetical protein B1987_03695 [Mycobacterium kansasii]